MWKYGCECYKNLSEDEKQNLWVLENIVEWDKTLYNYKKYKKQIIFKLDIFDLKIWVSEKNVWFEWKKKLLRELFQSSFF